MTREQMLIESFEAVSRANKDLSDYLIDSVKAVEAAVLAERERCAKIAEMPNMAPADIARAIRNG